MYNGCVFQNNVVKESGGVLSVSKKGMVAMYNCTVSNKSAEEDPGTIFLTYDSKLFVNNSYLDNNICKRMEG